MLETIGVTDAFAAALDALDEEGFQLLYGRWDPLEPAQVANLFSEASLRWYVAGGRAARVGAPARHHDDTDIAVRAEDLDQLRQALADWHLWEAGSGSLRPLLPGVAITEGCQQLWARRNAREPWQIDVLLDRSGNEWVFKRDKRISVPWDRALQTVDGICYLRPEIALLHKAHLDRPKDREDLAVARLDADARTWLAQALQQLGHHSWAQQVTNGSSRSRYTQ
jgi:Aminoglycoside-2''-adenylyltransferase